MMLADVSSSFLGDLVVGIGVLSTLFLSVEKVLDLKSRRNGGGRVTISHVQELHHANVERIELLNGKVDVLNSRFEAWMAERRVASDSHGVGFSDPKHRMCPGTRYRILQIEDNEADQAMMRELLCRKYDIECAGSLSMALHKLRVDSPYDCVLLDLKLPDCHGIDTLKRFRDECPAACAIVVSGAVDDRLVADASRLGYDATLNKAECTTEEPVMQAITSAIIRHQMKKPKP